MWRGVHGSGSRGSGVEVMEVLKKKVARLNGNGTWIEFVEVEVQSHGSRGSMEVVEVWKSWKCPNSFQLISWKSRKYLRRKEHMLQSPGGGRRQGARVRLVFRERLADPGGATLPR